MIAKPISNYLEQQLPEMVALLRLLVLAESPSTDPTTQAGVQAILTEQLEGMDFNVKHIPGNETGGHLLAEYAGNVKEADSQLLLGHSDTVWPKGTLSGMPFRIDGPVARGPGVFDMKGGLVQMLFALRAIRNLKLQPELRPVVFVNSDEEIGSPESEPLIRDLAQKVRRAYVLEPSLGSSGKLKTARKGVGQFQVTITGRAAHAGLDPEKGISAIVELAHIIQAFDALNRPAEGINVNIGTVEGGVRPNVIAPECRAVVDVRVPTAVVAREIEREISGFVPRTEGVTIQIEGGVNRQPLERTPANRLLWSKAVRLGESMGLSLKEGSVGGGSDGNITSQYVSTLDGLGAVGDGAHASHEFIRLDKMAERATLLALLILADP